MVHVSVMGFVSMLVRKTAVFSKCMSADTFHLQNISSPRSTLLHRIHNKHMVCTKLELFDLVSHLCAVGICREGVEEKVSHFTVALPASWW